MTKANLSQLQDYLNKYYSWMDNCYCVQLLQTKDEIIMNVKEDGTEEILNTYTIDTVDDMEQLIKSIICKVYEQDINHRNRIVNGWKSFSKRKVGSMSRWMQKGNTEKVTEINKELIEKYNEVENLKYEVRDLKTLITALYRAKEHLCKVAA